MGTQRFPLVPGTVPGTVIGTPKAALYVRASSVDRVPNVQYTVGRLKCDGLDHILTKFALSFFEFCVDLFLL